IRPLDVAGVVDDYLTIDIRRRLGADDVITTPQFSTDLLTWLGGADNLVPVSVINNNDRTETLTFRTANPVSAGAHLFVRGQFLLVP
ncbi:MAG: hypothetical protein HRU37_07475, partial [Roseibacillus sp.]|nr:hypothetical protein [Roseibacillus sp.]